MKGFCMPLGLPKTKGGNEKKAALAERLTPVVSKEAAQLLSEYLKMCPPVRNSSHPTCPDLLPPPATADDPTRPSPGCAVSCTCSATKQSLATSSSRMSSR